MTSFLYKVADFNFQVSFINSWKLPEGIFLAYSPFEITENNKNNASEKLLFHLIVDKNFTLEESSKKIGYFNKNDNSKEIYRLKDGGYQFKLFNQKNKLIALIQSNPTFNKIHVSLHGNEQEMSSGLCNSIMISYTFSSAFKNTILIHSSVTTLNHHAYLFLGKSGTGKSTHSALWIKNFRGAELLNDDNPVIRFINGKVRVYGTPWSGKMPCYHNLSAEVCAFVMLEQKPYNKIEKQDNLHAFASLLTSCSLMMWDKRTYNNICSTISSVMSLTPVYHLECLPNIEAAELCHSVIER